MSSPSETGRRFATAETDLDLALSIGSVRRRRRRPAARLAAGQRPCSRGLAAQREPAPRQSRQPGS